MKENGFLSKVSHSQRIQSYFCYYLWNNSLSLKLEFRACQAANFPANSFSCFPKDALACALYNVLSIAGSVCLTWTSISIEIYDNRELFLGTITGAL